MHVRISLDEKRLQHGEASDVARQRLYTSMDQWTGVEIGGPLRQSSKRGLYIDDGPVAQWDRFIRREGRDLTAASVQG